MNNSKTHNKRILPDLTIVGVGKSPEARLQSLIEIEPILAHYYDKPDEKWNNTVGSKDIREYMPDPCLQCTPDRVMNHFSIRSVGITTNIFRADQITDILQYIEQNF